jgi:xylulokinase
VYIGLDLGTSSVKALIIDDQQTIRASASAPLDVLRPHPQWSEQDPGAWIAAVEAVFDSLKQDAPDVVAAVKAIGLSGQQHGATLLDAADQVLRPCILWNDIRSGEQARVLDADPQFRNITGNIVFPGFTAPKLLWVKQHEPEIFDRVRRVLLPKDYVRLWLTGDAVSDMSDASGTSWLDVGKRDWSAELLAATHLDRSAMPRLVEGCDVAAQLRSVIATRFGMADSVVVAGGAGDNAASACGLGVVAAKSAFVSLGTSGVLFATTDRFLPNAGSAVHAFCHALPQTWHQMGVIISATDSLNWYAHVLGKTPAQLDAELSQDLQPPSRVTFLPYLSGERTPHNDVDIRGAMVGLDRNTDAGELTRAIYSGVAFALRDCINALQVAGTTITQLTAVGGGSRSRYWLSTLATVLGISIDVPVEGDYGAAFGAARLGLAAAEQADPVAVCRAAKIIARIEPDSILRDGYDAAYERYRALYPLLKLSQ